MNNKIFLLIAIIFIVFSCKEKKIKVVADETQVPKESENPKPDTNYISSIGAIKISEQTIKYRIATELAYGNSGLNMTTGLIMLINDALEMELAKKYNQQAIPDEIEQFKQYADQTSKAPEILKKVKDAFGSDVQAYDQWYISPKIVNRKIRDYFSADKSINQAALNQIKPALKMLRSGKKMKETAKYLNITFAIDSISVKPLDMTPALQDYPDAKLPFENPMLKYVQKMKVGDLYPDVIEENYSFLIIKLFNFNHDRYLIERISVSKPDFDTWFKKEAAGIPLQIKNNVIKQELKTKYNNLWWVRFLK